MATSTRTSEFSEKDEEPIKDTFPDVTASETKDETEETKEGAYETDVDVRRFDAFKKLMKHSEVYTEFLRQKMVSQVAVRKFEWNRKLLLMKHSQRLYEEKNVAYERYLQCTKAPDCSNEDAFSILCGEMLNAAGEVVPMKQPFSLENASLRPYQIEGLNWLKTLFEYGINGILADEMGLGKTIQSISIITHLYEMGVSGYYLVVAPLSTLYNWIAEFQRFVPKLPVLLYHGTKEERMKLRNNFKPTNFFDLKVTPVIVTSYEIVIKDRSFLHGFKWKYMIVDEGHRLKNFHCRLFTALKSFHSSSRLLLTGTPLQNNLAELWSLMNFLIPEVFTDLVNFESWFDADGLLVSENCDRIIKMEREQQALSTMHRILRPFVLRRKKCEVELNLPPKKEVLVFAPMTDLQKTYYKATLDRSITKVLGLEAIDQEEECNSSEEEAVEPPKKRIAKESKIHKLRSMAPSSRKGNRSRMPTGKTNVKMSNVIMQLRKITNHPYLVHFPFHPHTEEVRIDEDMVASCGKLLVLDAMLKRLKKMGHKILLFSQMTKLMDILEDYLEMRNYSYVRFDGSTNVAERQAAIELFNRKGTFIFLLSTRAGGLGINLTSADTVIIYDSDWNPQCDIQAIDRCHRIGQTLPVVIYRLVTSGTIDERMVELAQGKCKLEAMVIGKGNFKQKDENVAGISVQELEELLDSKSGQFRIQPNGLVFSDEELNCLLDRHAIISGRNDPLSERMSPVVKETSNRTNLTMKPLNLQPRNKDRDNNRVYTVL